jgi:hypothetical protein
MSQQPAYDKYLGIDTRTGMPRSKEAKEVPLCAGIPRYSAANLSIDCGYGWSSSLRPNFHASSRAFQFGEAEEQRDIYIPAWFGLAVIAVLVLTALACPICTAIVATCKGRWSTGWFAIGPVFGRFGLLAAIGFLAGWRGAAAALVGGHVLSRGLALVIVATLPNAGTAESSKSLGVASRINRAALSIAAAWCASILFTMSRKASLICLK